MHRHFSDQSAGFILRNTGHTDREEVKLCVPHWLTDQGYSAKGTVGSREVAMPSDHGHNTGEEAHIRGLCRKKKAFGGATSCSRNLPNLIH